MSKLFPNVDRLASRRTFKQLRDKTDLTLGLKPRNCKFYKVFNNYAWRSEQGRLVQNFQDYVLKNHLPIIKDNIRVAVNNMVVADKVAHRHSPERTGRKTEEKLLMRYGHRVCGYIVWARYANLTLTINDMMEMDPQLFESCRLVDNSKNYNFFWASPILIQLPSFEIVNN